MNIGILGAGYVGLVTGACSSDFGHNVVCCDKSKKKVSLLKKNVIPIYEPGLESLIEKNVKASRLRFESDLKKCIDQMDVIFVAVDTPSRRVDGQADLESLFSAVDEISKIAKKNKVIVLKSTVPVGTNAKVSKRIIQVNNKIEFEIVSNPEFLREGSALEDFMKPDRIVIGTYSKIAEEIMKDIYKPLYLRDFPILFTNPESAELIKYSSNAFLATKISFINEVANLCEKTGADVKDVSKGLGLDKRIGDKFLHPGPGYGGSCFPKDTAAFVNTGKVFGAEQSIVETVIKANHQVKNRMIEKITSFFDGSIIGSTICFFGVTFKPNTDDMREAPSLTIIPSLQSRGANIKIMDPKGQEKGAKLLPNVKWFSNAYEAAEDADLLVILTEWNEFIALDLPRLAKCMRSAKLADLRNIYSEKKSLIAALMLINL